MFFNTRMFLAFLFSIGLLMLVLGVAGVMAYYFLNDSLRDNEPGERLQRRLDDMKRFLVFGGKCYYSAGGFNDLVE